MKENPRWLSNRIQFPRLLAEIDMAGLTDKQYELLKDSMDLNRTEINELFDRAHVEWEKIKKEK